MKRAAVVDTKSERFFWVLAAALFAVLVLANYSPVLLGKIPLPGVLLTYFPSWTFQPDEARQPVADIGDLIDYFYPFHRFSAEQIRQGTIPLWNPYVMAGIPFQAEPQTAMFYPLHILYYAFSTPTAWSLALIARMWLAAMFMTLLIRSIGASKTGALVAGIVFSFAGPLVAWQGTALGDAMIWLPLMCYSVHRLHGSRSRFFLALTAFAFAMPVLAGHPETAAHVILTAFVAAMLIWAFPPDHESRFDMQFLRRFFIAGVLAVGLASVQLLPTLEWILESRRSLETIWPSFELHQGLGFFSRDVLRGPNSAGIFVPNAVGYVGMLTLLAAALGVLHSSRRYVLWFMGLVAVGIAGTYGIEPVHWLLTHTPIVKGLRNERLILLADFGLAALAGLGISFLEEQRAARSAARRVLPWLLVGAMFLVVLFCVQQLQLATQIRVEVMRRPSFSRTLLLAALILVAWRMIRAHRAKLFPAAACALLVFDLVTFAYGYTGFTRRDEVFPTAPIFDFLRQQGSAYSFRIARAGQWAYPANTGISYGLQSVTGFEANSTEAMERFTSDFAEDSDGLSLVGEKIVSINDRRLDMLNLKYLVVVPSRPEYAMFAGRPERFAQVFRRGDVAVFENKAALPRAFLVPAVGIRVIPDVPGQFQLLKDPTFDPRRAVVLYEQPAEFIGIGPTPDSEFSGNVETVDGSVNGYHFRVQASAPAVLIVSQNFYPGWKAITDGVSQSVFPANHALAGIAVPAGNHDVRFVFDPLPFKVGLAASVVSALVLAGLAVSRRKSCALNTK
jgi:hypothetical protein